MATEAGGRSAEIDDLLAGRAMPIVRRVVAQRLGGSRSEQEDICAQVLLELTLHVRSPGSSAPRDEDAFSRYVAVAAHHGCDHYLRRKYPLRWRLRNRIRYVLEHDPRLALWKGRDGLWWCGRLGAESDAAGSIPPRDQLARVDGRRIGPLLHQLFLASGGPLRLSDVVDVTAAVWQVPAVVQHEISAVEDVADSSPRIDRAIEQREKARRTWQEILALPVRQRHALLLNLKHDAINFLITTGIASLRAVAASLDMPVEALAAIWKDLPLSDNDIAARQGCTRQQVINLRMAARKRLANRLAGWS